MLPKLPYSFDALEPFIDARTMEIHYTKHHQTYLDKFNAAVKGTEFEDSDVKDLLKNIKDIPEEMQMKIINFGGGYENHNFFWEIMGPDSGGEPTGDLADEIDNSFGGFQQFQQSFSENAKNLFGSGWTWLVLNNGKLEIINTQNQNSPLSDGKIPLLCIDIWEHAYYLKYQNKRAEFIDEWWNVVNWNKVEELYNEAIKET